MKNNVKANNIQLIFNVLFGVNRFYKNSKFFVAAGFRLRIRNDCFAQLPRLLSRGLDYPFFGL